MVVPVHPKGSQIVLVTDFNKLIARLRMSTLVHNMVAKVANLAIFAAVRKRLVQVTAIT